MYLVIGKENCPWCKRATELLKENKEEFYYANLDRMSLDDAKIFKNLLKEKLNLHSVPQIFSLVGGFSDLEKRYA